MSNIEFDINIKHLSEKNYVVKVTDETTVKELKSKLQDITKSPADQMKLIFKGKILKVDDDKMIDLKITEGSALHMIINKGQEEQPTQNQANPNVAPQQPTTGTNPNPFNTTGNSQPGFNNQNPFGGMGGMGGLGGLDFGAMGGMGGMDGMGGMGGMNPQMMQQMMANPQFRTMAQNLLSNPDALRNMISSNPMLSQMAQNNPQLQTMINDPQMMQNMQGLFGGPAPQNPQGQPNTQDNTGTQPQPQPQMQMPDLSAFMNNPQLAQGMGGFGGMGGMGLNPGMFPTPPQSNIPPEEEYKEQLQRLEEMGFTNKEVNITVLKQCYGNVDLAIDRLLGMFN